MYENEGENNEIFSKALRAGRRTYFFDIRGTKAGDYYLTITESKKFTHDDGSSHYQKHKIYLYKEDFNAFREILDEMTSYVFEEKGQDYHCSSLAGVLILISYLLYLAQLLHCHSYI